MNKDTQSHALLGSVSDRFSVTITEESGNLTLDIYDYKTKTKTSIDEVLSDSSPLTLGWMCKFIVEKLKPRYRDVINPH